MSWKAEGQCDPQRRSPKLAHQGERFSFAAAASAAWSPNKAERERAAEECHITLETGGDLTPGFIEGFASEVTSTVAVVGAGIPGAQSTRGMVASDRALREPSG